MKPVMAIRRRQLFSSDSQTSRYDTSICATPFAVIGCCLFILSSPVLAGTTFGIYDARTLAMGGASVASANNDNAQFYNAALLAFNDEIEERTEDSRFLFPIMIPQAGRSAITLEQLAGDNPTAAFSRVISDFNTTPDALTAQAVVDTTANIDASLASLDGKDVFADIYFGLAISEPGKFQGAGFFLGTRLLAGGETTVAAADRAVLADYQEGLAFVASNGAQGTARPDLFDANGALIDPGNDFDTTVSAAGAIVTEAGVAMSRQFSVFGQPFAAGFTFKAQRVDTFEDVDRVVDDRIDTDRNREHYGKVNFDVGVVKEIGERWRVGLAIKDIIPKNYDTTMGTPIRFRPRARIGAAYQNRGFQISVDADLTENEPLGNEQVTQETAIGAEWTLASALKLRAGYRHAIKGNRDGIASLGIGTVWKRLAFDLAYAEGDDARAAAIQFGLVF